MKADKLQKYQQTFKDQIAKQIDQWTQGRDESVITTADVYHLLHKIKGTGATIDLPLWSAQAELLLEDLHSNSDYQDKQVWTWEQTMAFISPITTLLGGEHISETAATAMLSEEVIIDNTQSGHLESGFVLLVTERAQLVNVFKTELEKLGWTVIAMDSAKRATRSFFLYKPDLLLIDAGLAIDEDDTGRYLLNKVDAYGIPRALISSSVEPELLEEWDAVLEFPAANLMWINQCKRLIKRGHMAQRLLKPTAMPTEALLYQWSQIKLWLGEEAVLAYVDLTGLREINERYGYAAGDKMIDALAALLRDQFPEAATYHAGEDDFFLLFKSASAQRVQPKIEDAVARLGTMTATVRTTMVKPGDDISVSMRKLRDGNLLKQGSDAGQAGSKPKNQEYFLGVIDDDEIVRKMLEEQFRSLPNVKIATFREGESFFEDEWHKQEGQYLLIVDGMMPRMDGFEVVYKIRTQYDQSKYSILMLTARKSEKDIVRALELGVDDYITKPFGVRELEARVRRLFKRLER